MQRLARVTATAAVFLILATLCTGCPGGGLPSLVGLWIFAVDAFPGNVGVQINADGSADPVDIGTGFMLSGTLTWDTFSDTGFIMVQEISGSEEVVYVGTRNADGAMNGHRAFTDGMGNLERDTWTATQG
jgi:hypothetical protein